MAGMELCSFYLFLVLTLVAAGTEEDLASFEREHIDSSAAVFNNDPDYCDNMMKKRGLYGLKTNTFIHARIEQVTALCAGNSIVTHVTGRVSRQPFRVTLCRLKDGKAGGQDRYYNVPFESEIYIECKDGVPVKFNSFLM